MMSSILQKQGKLGFVAGEKQASSFITYISKRCIKHAKDCPPFLRCSSEVLNPVAQVIRDTRSFLHPQKVGKGLAMPD